MLLEMLFRRRRGSTSSPDRHEGYQQRRRCSRVSTSCLTERTARWNRWTTTSSSLCWAASAKRRQAFLGAIWERIAYGGVGTYGGAESSPEATRC